MSNVIETEEQEIARLRLSPHVIRLNCGAWRRMYYLVADGKKKRISEMFAMTYIGRGLPEICERKKAK